MAEVKSKGTQTVHCEIEGKGKGRFQSFDNNGCVYHEIVLSNAPFGHQGQHLPLDYASGNEVKVAIKDASWNTIWNSNSVNTFHPIDEGDQLVLTIGGGGGWTITLNNNIVGSSSDSPEPERDGDAAG